MRVAKDRAQVASIAAMLLWCFALIAYRVYLSPDKLPVWLFGNLCLATIPVLCSTAVRAASARKNPILGGLFFFVWLLFLPNAPYILTDLIHLGRHPNVPVWYDLAMLVFCAGAGVMLGYLSLLEVHNLMDGKFGKTTGWAVACGSLMLSGFGVYLGRFLRWNSWNAVTNPLRLAKSMFGVFIDSGAHPPPLPVTFVFGGGLIVGYCVLRAIARP